MPRGKRKPGNTQISISIAESFRDEIDAAAAEENRTRSNYIVTVLAKKLAERKARIALEAGAPHAPTFHSTARVTPTDDTHSLNEETPKRDAVRPIPAPPRETPTRKILRAQAIKHKPQKS